LAITDLMDSEETIFARASGAGRAGIAVFRVSGPKVRSIIRALFNGAIEPRKAHLRKIVFNGDLVDEGLVLFFPGPQSFTGEDVLEFHLHGARSIEITFHKILQKLGVRLAEAGEFTLRAMKNGKMDLAQTEALSDLIDSETNQQRMQALGQYEGALSDHAFRWRQIILQILASIAADIDFADEGDVPEAISGRATPFIEELLIQLTSAKASNRGAKMIREGISIVLLGAPNGGKSSLLNRLAGSNVAIVSDQPGTTRDIVEARLDINGLLVTLLDTAGLRAKTDDQIEQEGMRRTLERASMADVKIYVQDIHMNQNVSRETFSTIRAETDSIDFLILNKIDLIKDYQTRLSETSNLLGEHYFSKDQIFPVSAVTGEGISEFLETIENFIKERAGSTHSDQAILTRDRHYKAVDQAIYALNQAKLIIGDHPELAGEELRRAQRALTRLTGGVDIEDVLGEIFANFCIGK